MHRMFQLQYEKHINRTLNHELKTNFPEKRIKLRQVEKNKTQPLLSANVLRKRKLSNEGLYLTVEHVRGGVKR